jgi:uncharacterized Fe-S cluster-containing radical SAM superfamily protein
MDCAFCWSWRTRIHPEQFRNFYDPKEVATKLVNIAHQNDFEAVRIGGNEPTLCWDHLIGVIRAIEQLDSDLLFILETKGMI